MTTNTTPAVERRRDVAMAALASLRAAISLLERGGKKAAASDRMFAQMLLDYHKAADDFAASLASPAPVSEPVAGSGEVVRPKTLTMPNGDTLHCDYPDSHDWAKSWTVRGTSGKGATGEQDWEIVESYGLTAILNAALPPSKPDAPTIPEGMIGEWREIEPQMLLKGLRRSPKYYPAIGETCRVSGPNCDDADGYTWLDQEVLWRDELFIVTRTPGCWPTITKLELALFEPCEPIAYTPVARPAATEECLACENTAYTLDGDLCPLCQEPFARPAATAGEVEKRLRNPTEFVAAIELWFSRDLSETQRRLFCNVLGFPGVEANTLGLQMRVLRHVIAALASDRGEVERLREAFPKTIGRLSLGDQLSEDHHCAGSHDMPDGQPIYWTESIGEYPDDIDGYCLRCAIEKAESDAGWCECSIQAVLAEPDGAAEVAAQDAGDVKRLRGALEKCRDQFAFYAAEHHAKADNPATYYKDAERYREKAETNEQFANIARAALGEKAK